MSDATLTETEAPAAASHATKYTRNNPFLSTVLVNDLLTGAGSEKETRHIELSLEDGMEYTPGDAVGIIPENRSEAVDEVLEALKMTGSERVLDHYKVEIGLGEALRTRLQIGKLARGSINQLAKVAPGNDGLKALAGVENKARAEEYCWGARVGGSAGGLSGDDHGSAAAVPGGVAADAADVLDRVEPGDAPGECADDGARGAVRVARQGAAGSGERAHGRSGSGWWVISDLSACECGVSAA